MAQMHNPPHPGETLREDVLPKLGLTASEAARQLVFPASSFPAFYTAVRRCLRTWRCASSNG